MATRPTDDRPAGGAKRVLVLANEAVGGERLVEEIAARVGDSGSATVRIVSPALVASPLDLAAGDVDDEIEAARLRLGASIDALRRQGIEAGGEVGEAEPALALRDALVKFPADDVIVIAHPEESATWLEQGLLEDVRRDLTVPITYVEAESGPAGTAVKDVREVRPAGREHAARRRAEEAATDYLPPMPRRDRVALALGPLGTVALWLLASDCQGRLAHDFGGLDAGCVAVTLLAVVGLVVTAIHVPALLLLRSGRATSKGLADFMSLTILAYFPAALVAGVIVAAVV